MMIARFVGGPWDGRIKELAGEPSIVRCPVADTEDWPRSIDWKPRIVEYRRTRWTRDGCRLYVAQGHDRSLIGDEEIAAAAAWLGRHQIEDDPDMWADRERLARMRADYFAAAMRRTREGLRDARAPEQVMDWEAATFMGRTRYAVRVAPGLALGYRDDETEPCWRWPVAPEEDGSR